MLVDDLKEEKIKNIYNRTLENVVSITMIGGKHYNRRDIYLYDKFYLVDINIILTRFGENRI